MAKRHDYKGRLMTRREIYAEDGRPSVVSFNRFRRRLIDGWSIRDALTKPYRWFSATKYEVNGEWMTLKDMNKKYDKPVKTLVSRLKWGLSPSEAVMNEPLPRGGKRIGSGRKKRMD